MRDYQTTSPPPESPLPEPPVPPPELPPELDGELAFVLQKVPSGILKSMPRSTKDRGATLLPDKLTVVKRNVQSGARNKVVLRVSPAATSRVKTTWPKSMISGPPKACAARAAEITEWAMPALHGQPKPGPGKAAVAGGGAAARRVAVQGLQGGRDGAEIDAHKVIADVVRAVGSRTPILT